MSEQSAVLLHQVEKAFPLHGGRALKVLDLEHLVGPELDRFGDGVPVHRAELQGTENQKIEGALQQLNLVLSGHKNSLVGNLPDL